MKKSTKTSLIIFIVIFVVGYVMTCFIPDEILRYATINGSVLSFVGNEVVKLVGMRTIVAFAIALIVVLLIRIVDTEEKAETTKKVAKKKENKKVNNTEKKETK